jgi:NADH-quinone oxidoreductase subunit N
VAVLLVEVLVYTTLASSLAIPLLAATGYHRSRAILALSWLGVLSFLLASLLVFASNGVELYSGLVRHDAFTSIILLGAGLSACLALLAVGYDGYRWFSHPAFYSLLPLVLFGTFYLAGANNVLVVIASWLLVSVASYVLVALPGDSDSRMASIKYIYVGMVATLLIAIWASVHVSRVDGLLEVGMLSGGNQPLALLALLASISAFGFKVGIVPFHWWLPSVYGRADGRVIAVVAGVAKLGFIAIIVRLITQSFSDLGYTSKLLAVLAVTTMTYGNIAALTTTDLQRLLAYSSIAHIGYITAAAYVLSIAEPGSLAYRMALAGIALQSIAYTIAKTPLFLLTSEAGRSLEGELRGLLARDRQASISVAVLLASLLGIPPLLGFWGKLYMFLPLASYSIAILAIALVNSGVSSAYYVRALRDIVTTPEGAVRGIREGYRTALTIGAVMTVILGLIAPLVLSVI